MPAESTTPTASAVRSCPKCQATAPAAAQFCPRCGASFDGAPATAGVAPVAPPWYVSYRWAICALLFFATTINYVDRAVLGVLAPTLRQEIGWSDQE